MSQSLAEHIYPRLPIFLQNFACWYYGKREARVRFGSLFEQRLGRLMESEKWTKSEIEAYQEENLRALIRHAYEAVPFYRERMKLLKLRPADIRCRQDLAKLPLLTKEDVRHNFAALLSETASPGQLILRHTSGTTGKSLEFYSSRAGIAFQWAVWWRHRMRFGLTFDAWHANFTGKLVVPPEQDTPPYWRWNRPMHQALLTMHHLTPAKITHIISFLDGNPFEFYSGYPSIIHALVMVAREAGLRLKSPPRLIVTGAENVLDYQQRDCQEFIGAVLTDQYGLSEGCGNASQCREFRYHEDFEFGVLELADAAAQDGKMKAHIVCTGFATPEFPFIRYDTGDIATWDPAAPPCACGRQSAVLDAILGRADDYVVTPEGRRIMRFDYVFKEARNVRESQIVQDRPGEIRVRIVRRLQYSTEDEHAIAGQIHKWISPSLNLKFEYVEEIEREASGKFRAVKSNLPAAHSPAAS